MTTLADAAAHADCTLTACLDPLHKGPCKGWKGALRDAATKRPDSGQVAKDASGDAHQAGKAVTKSAAVHVNKPAKVALKSGAPGTITTPSGKVYQRLELKKPAPAEKKLTQSPGVLKSGDPGTITTPSGRVYQKVAAPKAQKVTLAKAAAKHGSTAKGSAKVAQGRAKVETHAAKVKAAEARLAEVTARLKAHQAKPKLTESYVPKTKPKKRPKG